MATPTLARLSAAPHGHGPAKPWSKPPVASKPGNPRYRIIGTTLGASMWFFLMYRAKQDGAALLGLKHPWDH